MRDNKDPERIKIAWQDPAMMQIGKGGVSESVVKEALRLLKKHQYMKIRVLRTAIGETSKIDLVESLCEKTGAKLAGFRGNTAVIYKSRTMKSSE